MLSEDDRLNELIARMRHPSGGGDRRISLAVATLLEQAGRIGSCQQAVEDVIRAFDAFGDGRGQPLRRQPAPPQGAPSLSLVSSTTPNTDGAQQ